MKRIAFFFLVMACNAPRATVDAGSAAEPPATCTKLGAPCTFAPGKLGSCVEIEQTSGVSAFVCQSQH